MNNSLLMLICLLWHFQAEAGPRYADSIESLVRNNIQKMKIDMANEVIDAGRFDMNTTMDERRQTLEEMLQVRGVALPPARVTSPVPAPSNKRDQPDCPAVVGTY